MKIKSAKKKILCVFLAAVLLLPQMPLRSVAVNAAETADAEWWNFRNTETNNAVTDRPTPTSDSEAWEKWSARYGTGYAASPTPPIIVNGKLYAGVGKQIIEISKETGEVLRTSEEMPGNVGYAMQSPVYADGKIFVAITQGRICAVNLSDLSLAWTTDNSEITAGQTVSPISYVKIGDTGYIYTGTWTTKGGDLLCATTDDSGVSDGIKQLTWHFNPAVTDAEGLAANNSVAVGYYWTGAYVCEKYLAIGSDNGSPNGDQISDTAFYTLNPRTGAIIDAVYGIHGQVRSTTVFYDGYLYFSTKDAKIYKIKVDADGNMDDDQVSFVDLAEYGASSATATPVVYGGRIYFGVQGKGGEFSSDGGHGFAVVRDDETLSAGSFLYMIPVPGYPQAGALLSTYHEAEDFDGDGSADGRIYLFFTYNAIPGGIYYTYDTPGQTEPTQLTAEASRIFVPSSGKQQYCISSIVADREGTLYYKNDSGYLFAVESNPAALNDLQVMDEAGNSISLDQAFQTKRAEYSATIPSSVNALTIKLQMTEGAAATVAGKAYTEENKITLQEGTTEIPVVVTKAGKSRTYTLTAVRQSGNANLSALASAKGNAGPAGSYTREITPAFDKDVTEYEFNWIKTGTNDATDPSYGSSSRIMNLFLTPESDKVNNNNIRVWPGENCSQPKSASETDGSVKCYTVGGNTGYKYRYPVYSSDITRNSTARIAVTAEDGTVKEYFVTFVRRINVTDISMDQNSLSLEPGETGELSVTFNPDAVTDQSLEWISSDPGVATVSCMQDEEGREIPEAVVTAVSPGTAVIQAVSNETDGRKTASVPVTVTADGEEHVHVWDAGTTDPQPDCTNEGMLTYTCTEDPLHTLSVPVPAVGHVLMYRPAIAASCEQEGRYEHYECTVCGRFFPDPGGETEITEVIIPATGHNFGKWTKLDENLHQRICSSNQAHKETAEHIWDTGTVVKEPSAGTEGQIIFACTDCNARRAEVIPALPAEEASPAKEEPSDPSGNPSSTAKEPDRDAITPADRTAEAAKESNTLAIIPADRITAAGNLSKKTMTVSWNASPNAVNYRIAWKKAADSKWNYLWSGGKTSCTLSKLKKGTLCEIMICAYQKEGSVWVRSAWSDVSRQYFRTVSKVKLKAGKKAVTVSWKKDKQAGGYQIQYSLKKNMKNAKTVNVSKKKTSYKLKKLKSGKKYYIRVRPIRKYSGKKYSGMFSAKKKARVK